MAVEKIVTDTVEHCRSMVQLGDRTSSHLPWLALTKVEEKRDVHGQRDVGQSRLRYDVFSCV